MTKVICNKVHSCMFIKENKCIHSKPHYGTGAGCDKPIGGAPAMCHQGKMVSICAPIVDGKYKCVKTVRCQCGHPKCNGWWREEEEFEVMTQELVEEEL